MTGKTSALRRLHVLWIFRLKQTKLKEEGFLGFFAVFIVPIIIGTLTAAKSQGKC